MTDEEMMAFGGKTRRQAVEELIKEHEAGLHEGKFITWAPWVLEEFVKMYEERKAKDSQNPVQDA